MSGIPNYNRRSECREATRREILDAAWEIARREGLSAVTLREVAGRIGMRSPPLYSHFDSKNAIYDAMFAQAWGKLCDVVDAVPPPPEAPRRAMLVMAETFFDFSTADMARYQLMNRAAIPGFRPSEEARAALIAAYERMRGMLHRCGLRAQADMDLWTAIIGGLIDQQLANDPSGSRWRRQLPRLVDMYCDEVGVPGPQLRRAR
jgi:AcrR family transcriptional regulator